MSATSTPDDAGSETAVTTEPEDSGGPAELLETLKGHEIRAVKTYARTVLVKQNGDVVYRGEVIDSLDPETDEETIRSLMDDHFEDEFGPGASPVDLAEEAAEVLEDEE
jgi:hypothetical protein